MNEIEKIDFNYMAWLQSLKSYTPEEIRQGLCDGHEIWLFYSGESGNDDVLLYPPGIDPDEIRHDLEDFLFLQNNKEVPKDLWDRNRRDRWFIQGPYDAQAAARKWPI